MNVLLAPVMGYGLFLRIVCVSVDLDKSRIQNFYAVIYSKIYYTTWGSYKCVESFDVIHHNFMSVGNITLLGYLLLFTVYYVKSNNKVGVLCKISQFYTAFLMSPNYNYYIAWRYLLLLRVRMVVYKHVSMTILFLQSFMLIYGVEPGTLFHNLSSLLSLFIHRNGRL